MRPDSVRHVRLASFALTTLAAAATLAGEPAASAAAEPTYESRTAQEWVQILAGDSASVMKCVEAFRSMGPQVVPLLLVEVRQNASEKVRGGAAEALGKIGGEGVAPALAEVVSREADSDAGQAAALALAKLSEKGDAQAGAELPRARAALQAVVAGAGPKGLQAGRCLAALGPEGAALLLSTFGAAQNPDVREGIMAALSLARGEGIDAGLVRGLEDADVHVRLAAARTIGYRAHDPSFGAASPVAVAALVRSLKDPKSDVRAQAVRALMGADAAAAQALPALREVGRADADPVVREAALIAVGALEAIPATVFSAVPAPAPERLPDGSQLIRGTQLAEWARAFVAADGIHDSAVRAALSEAGPAALPVLRAAIRACPDRKPRFSALSRALDARLGGVALPEFIEGFAETDPSDWIRGLAAGMLAELARGGDRDAEQRVKKIIPRTIESLCKDPRWNGEPAQTLVQIGPLAQSAIEKAAKGHACVAARAGAVSCLAKWKDTSVFPAALHALKDESPSVRRVAIDAVAALMGSSEQTTAGVTGLAMALKDPDVEVKRAAALKLGRLGPPARAALPALREAAEKDPEVRTWAEGAIRELQ